MTHELYITMAFISFGVFITPAIIMATVTLAKLFWAFINDQELCFPDWVNKYLPYDAQDEVLAILFFLLYLSIAALSALLWVVALPCFLAVAIAFFTRTLVRITKKLKWVAKLVHTHPNNIEKTIEEMPPYSEL